MAGTGQQFYEEEEAEQILRLAASMSSPMGSMSRDRLIATAAELGITPEAVEKAEKQFRSQRAIESERAEFDRLQKREFYGHLISYVLVNAFLVAVNLFTSPGYFWAVWSILGWGLGLGFHVVSTFFKNSESYQEEFEKWQFKRGAKALSPIGATSAINISNTDAIVEAYVHQSLDRGQVPNKIAAIKSLRQATGLGLSESKHAVDQYCLRHPSLLD